MDIFFICLGAILVLLVAIILIRTLCFKPRAMALPEASDTDFDSERATKCLQELVRFKTISYADPSLEDKSQFDALISSLPSLYPNVFEKCERIELDARVVLLKWSGKNDTPSPASVLMAHFDVVPVDENGWEKPPFDAIIENGVLWGRGTLDTKATLNGALFGADTLIKRGFVPEHDVYLAFSGNEEINGSGAPTIVDYFEKNGIEIGLVLDEGGAVCENVFPGVKRACGMIGIAEKGMLNAEYKLKSNGGHASAPKPRSLIGKLSCACARVERHPFKMRISSPASQMFDTLGRHSSFAYRMIFANLWAFGWIINLLGKKSGGELNAIVRTTVAFTQATGSSAPNVLPTEASLISNMRLNPGDTVDSALAYLRKTVKNPDIEISAIYGNDPSRISRTDCDEYKKVSGAVLSTWQDALVTPYIMVQCSDSRHYGRLSDRVYRFSAMDLTLEERRSIHANNEKIRLESISKSCEFYINLIKKL